MRYMDFLAGFCVALLTGLLGLLGLFDLPDSLLYDQFVRLIPEQQISSTHILLIEAPPETMEEGDKTWLKLLKTLENFHPRGVVFTFLPGHVSNTFYETARRSGNVVFGREVRKGPSGRGSVQLEPFPPGVAGEPVKFGLVVDPPAYHGIHRHSYASFTIDGKDYPSLEGVVAKWSPEKQGGVSQLFPVNFTGKTAGLPRISLKRALSGELIPQLVKGRYIVVGFETTGRDRLIQTPTAPHKGISSLEFRGYALETLLTGRPITEVGGGAALLLVVGVVLLGIILPRFLNLRILIWAIAAITAAYFAIAWICLYSLSIWLPLAEMIVAHLLTSFLIFRMKIVQRETATYKISMDTSAKVQERMSPESFFDSQEYWGQILTMVNQTLDLTRAIFLEKIVGDHRVHEVAALHCSLSDISEMRRDYERAPYSTAISEGDPISVGDRDFFKRNESSEIQYVVPLLFGGKVVGFWAFGITPSKISGIADFQAVIREFADQIAELVFRRNRKSGRERSAGSFLRHHLKPAGRDTATEDLGTAVALLGRRLTLFEGMFDAFGSATILYDLFGRVLSVNRPMTELLKNSELSPYEMTAMDLIKALTDLQMKNIRDLLRHLIFDRKAITLRARFEKEEGRNFILNIHPLIHEENPGSSQEAQPFRTTGFLFELVEMTEFDRLSRLKEQLVEKLGYEIRHDLEPIVLASAILNDSDALTGQERELAGIIQSKVEDLARFIKHAQYDLDEDISKGAPDYYPVDPKGPMEDALGLLKEEADTKRLTFELEMPELADLVWAGPGALTDVIRSILEILMGDAVEGSAIAIDLVQMDDWLIYSFSNKGFGMPNAVFQKYLFETEAVVSHEFRKIRKSIGQVDKWGGVFSASSHMGEGIHFSFHLHSAMRYP